jgi:hypothetical protein
MLRESYDMVMNDDRNPLSALPKTTRFQIMTMLSFMWSVVFTISIGSYMLFGPTVVAHLAILVGVFFTADIFRRAKSPSIHHRDAMRDPRDGTALYDDLWGA